MFFAACGVALPVGAVDRSGLRPGLIDAPTGPGSIQGLGESFDGNPNSGTSSYSVSIWVPPGVAGHVPELALSYSSGGGNGELGLGWALAIPRIQRDVDKGLPTYGASDRFALKAMGAQGAEDLVEMDDGSFRLRIEGAFVKAVRRDDGSWSVRSKNGELYKFGVSKTARIAGGTQVFAWLLEEHVDINGNRVQYTYGAKDGGVYLESVRYNDFSDDTRNEVSFEYEERPDQLASFVAGFEQRTTRRLKQVVVRHGAKVLRTYSLTYGGEGISRLAAIELTGMNGEKMPRSAFEYVEFAPETAKVVAMKAAPARMLGDDSELNDVNGDALPDLLVMDSSLGDGRYVWYENLDGISLGPQQAMARSPSVWLTDSDAELADVDGDGIADVFARLVSGAGGLRYYPGAATEGFGDAVVTAGADGYSPSDSSSKLVDLNRDRLPDWLSINSTTGRMSVALNRGAGEFADASEVPVVTSDDLLTFEAGLRVVDMNGDGLMDLAALRSTALRYWPGMGFGKFGDEVSVPGAPSLPSNELAKAQLRDLNGDGLADLVLVGASSLRYWLNGVDRLEKAETVNGTPEVTTTTEVRLADMNANGTVDVVWIDPTASQPWRYLDLAPDGTPGLLAKIDNGIGKVTKAEYAGLGIMRAWAREQGIAWTGRMGSGQAVLKVLRTSTGLGADSVKEYRYTNGFFSPSAREFRGFADVQVTEVGTNDQPSLVSGLRFSIGDAEESEKGSLLRSEQRDAGGKLFERITKRYRTRTVETSRDQVALRFTSAWDETREVFEGEKEPLRALTEYDYDDYGNVVREAAYGLVVGDNLAVGHDERVTVRTYAVNESVWIVDRLASERVEDLDGTRLAERRIYYDGKAFDGLPLGQVERGNETRVASWIDGDRLADERSLERDEFGNIVVARDARGMSTRLEYDADTHTFLVRESQEPSGDIELAWTAGYGDAQGLLTSVTGPNGELSEFSYDGLGRVTRIVEPGDTLELPTRTFEYTPGSPVSYVRQSQRLLSGEAPVATTFLYSDGEGRGVATVEQGVQGEWILASGAMFGARGKESSRVYPAALRSADFPSLEGLPAAALRYDGQGRVVEVREVDGSVSRTEYGQLSRVVHDANDVDEASPHFGTPTRFEYDGLGRLVTVIERAAEREVVSGRYSYDPLGKLVSWSDAAGSERRYRYDGRSRRVALEDPNAGAWVFTFSDGNDQLSRTDPTGRRLRWEFDRAGRKLRELHQLPGVSERVEAVFHYDEALRSEQTNTRGQLASVEDSAGTVYYGYSARGFRVFQSRRLDDGREYSSSSELDARGLPRRRTFPDGSYYEISHDVRGLPERLGPFASEMKWTPAKQLASALLGNGIREQRSYDDRQRLTRLTAKRGKEVVRDLVVGLDGVGLVTSLDDRVRKDGTASSSVQLSHDDRYRMVGIVNPLGTTGWSLNDMGHASSVESETKLPHLSVENEFGGDGAGPDALTRFGDERLEYDGAGRLIRDGDRKLEWDASGRLTRVERGNVVEEYVYAHDDQRVIKRTRGEGTSEVVYLDADAEVRDGQLVRYVYSNGERLVRLDPTGAERTVEAAAGAAWTWRPPAWWVWLTALVACAVALVGGARGWLRAPRWGLLGLAVAGLGLGGCASGGTPITEVPESAVFWHADHQGSAVVLTDANGEILEERAHDAYGHETAQTGPAGEPYGFVGNEVDRGSGLSDFNARPYRPDTGQFLEPDPLAVFEPEKYLEQPSLAGAYSYGAGRPATLSDPEGLCSGCPKFSAWADAARRAGEAFEEKVEASKDAGIFIAKETTIQWVGGRLVKGAVGLVARTPPGKVAIGRAGSLLSTARAKVAGWLGRGAATGGRARVTASLEGLRAGKTAGVHVVASVEELQTLFRGLSSGGMLVKGSKYPGKLMQLADGTTVGLRAASKSGGPTIDIKLVGGAMRKVHVE